MLGGQPDEPKVEYPEPTRRVCAWRADAQNMEQRPPVLEPPIENLSQ